MEGFILTVASDDQHRLSFQKKKKQEWRKLFVKIDDISARLIAFTDQSKYEVCWSVQLVGADISTPLPGEPTYSINVEDTPYCFYVRETSVVKDCTHYFSAPDDSTKKAWVKALTQVVRDGPHAPRFTVSQAVNEFEFLARVAKFRLHVDGTHAEYMITCSCQVFSKIVARRLVKEWSLWRRFSEFDELNQALKKSMGPQLEGIDIVKHKRDAFRGFMGKAFDHDFLEERRVLLDSFVTNICKIRTAVDFFKHHSDPHLKAFFQFDDNCQHVDQSPHKSNGRRSRSNGNSSRQNEDIGRVPVSSRLSDIKEEMNSSHSRTSDAASDSGRGRSKGSRRTRQSASRASTSSQTSASSRPSSRASRASDTQVSSHEDDGSNRRHHCRHHKKSGNDEERPTSIKKDKHKIEKRELVGSNGSAEAEIRLADPTV